MGLIFDAEKKQEFDALNFRSKRRNLKEQLHRTGKTDKKVDEKRHALLAGKRMSKNGKVYWEGRINRSDSSDSNI